MNHFVIKGHRAALKKFKANPLDRVILVSKTGDIKCYSYEYWEIALPVTYRRVDLLACQHYRVRSEQLTEIMVKNTAIKILKGDL